MAVGEADRGGRHPLDDGQTDWARASRRCSSRQMDIAVALPNSIASLPSRTFPVPMSPKVQFL